MNPFKAKNAHLEIDQEEIDPAHTGEIYSYYWQYIRAQLSELNNPVINITGLGNMKIKHWKVDSTIGNLNKKVERWTIANKQSTIADGYAEDLKKVIHLKTKLQKELEHKTSSKLRKDEYYKTVEK